MRRFGAVLAALAVVCVAASQAGARTFTIVGPVKEHPEQPAVQKLPSYEQPNRPGDVVLPVALSTPPARPAVLSYDQLRDLWLRAGTAYGVPWQILGAINKVESNFGQNMGPSSAGAVGWMQFMPSTWDRWGTDADGDGVANPWNPEDAVYSAARYLAAAGAHTDISRAVFAYNHAQWYVDEILSLAADLGSGDAGFAAGLGLGAADYRLAGLQEQLADARKDISRAQRLIPAGESKVERLGRKAMILAQRAGNPRLSTDTFEELESRISALERAQERTGEDIDRRQADLDAAVAAVTSLEDQLAAAALADPATAALGAPGSIAGYVFPVGGGPTVVSVGHRHHDYPAADIAAPEGSPLYALANSVVLDAYPEPTGRCGIGFKLQVDSGPVYVYCHLAYLEPGVVPGAALAAGAPVGLVGSTGNSTGPHLHLQFSPALSYPQQEAWFESFAGTAFRWQGEPAPKRARQPAPRKESGPVFRIVQGPTASVDERVFTFTP
jgi:murein DD-endopeptidase MepM/ murein hydrolase activator NlpD